MKKLLTLFGAALLLACTSCAGGGRPQTSEVDDLSSFAVFLRNFTSDADYQLAHIHFPLGTRSGMFKRDANAPNGYLPVSFTEEVWVLKELDYFLIYPEEIEGGFTQLSPDKVLFERQGIYAGFFSKYTFERIDGEWYLTEGDESDSDVAFYDDVLPMVKELNAKFRKKFSRPDFVPYAGTAVEGEWPETSLRLLTREELAGCDKRELRLMRNEIFARHGYIFKSRDLNEYFLRTRWYAPLFSDVTPRLSDTELVNVELLRTLETER